MRAPTRRDLLAAWAAAAALPAAAADPAPVRLRSEGPERALSGRMLGFNTPANNVLPFEDPTFAPAVRALGPQLMRFPGGTVSNYYDWRTGQLEVARGDNDAVVRNLFARVADKSRAIHPRGVHWDEFHAFAERAGAELIVLPNIETSSLENEAARFADMAAKGAVPRRIELGNEFTHALLMDPTTLKVFPDFETSRARMKAYLDAIRPYLRPDARVAFQAAGTYLHHPPSRVGDGPRERRETDWDDRMRPEPWFDAVTLHLYPSASGVVSPEAARDLVGNLDLIYPAMIARADDGFDRVIGETAARMPGKEIWVTEWGGYDRNATFGGLTMAFTGIWLHQIVRAMLAQLRRPEVTVSTYHALFVRGDLGSVFRKDDAGGYVPVNSAGVLSWFFRATGGPDAHYQRVRADGSQRIAARGNIPGEGFRDVEAALFRQGRRRTLLVHNAWKTPRTLDLFGLADPAAPITAEAVSTPDLLASLQLGAPRPHGVAVAGSKVTAPAHALLRLTWMA